jgi:hypothetical protein
VVKTFAAATVGVKAAVEPVTVPKATVEPVLATFWFTTNWVGLKICVMTVPKGTPVPETGCPTTRPVVLVVVMVLAAVAPTAVMPKEALAVPH